MVNENVTAEYPTAIVTDSDVGVFTNEEGAVVQSDAAQGVSTLELSDASGFEQNQWLYALTRDGPNLMQVTSVNQAQNEVTVSRGEDGTVDTDIKDGDRVVATVPAKAVNQLRAETIALQEKVGTTSQTGTEGGVIYADANGDFAQDTDLTWDDTNDRLEAANVRVPSDGLLSLGDSDPYWFTYDSTGTQLLLGSTDVDGGGTDGTILSIQDGGDASRFHGDVSLDGTLTLENQGAGNDASLVVDTGASARITVNTALEVLNVSTGSNPILSSNSNGQELSLTGHLDVTGSVDLGTAGSGSLDINGTTLFENDRDLAVDLLPNADDSLDLGSASRTFQALHLQDGTVYQGLVVNETGGSNDFRAESTSEENMLLVAADQDQVNVHTNFNADWGALNVGARNASNGTEVDMVATLSDSGDSADVNGNNQDAWGVRIGNPTLNSVSGATTITDSAALYVPGPLQAGTDLSITNQYVALFEDGSGNKMFRFTGTGDFDIVSGTLDVGGTTVFENDRDLAVDLIPNEDDNLDLGSASRRFANVDGNQHRVFASSGDANPVVQVDSAGIKWGSGGGSSLDFLLKRTSGFLHLRDAGDNTDKALRVDEIRTQKIIGNPGANTTIRARDTGDSQVTVATLNRAATPTFDLDQARLTGTLNANSNDIEDVQNLAVGGTTKNFQIHQAGGNYAQIGAPNSSPTTGDMDNGSLIYWLDETNDELEIQAKYSDGTTKSGTVALS